MPKRIDKQKAEGLSEAEIRKLMLTKLAGSALDADDAKLMKLEPATRLKAQQLGLPSAKECFTIPYFDLKGRVTHFFRARYVVDTRKGFDKISGRKALRYSQPPDSITEVYLPPFDIDWEEVASDPSVPLIITEGELKAACATKFGHPTMGLGGVWSFQSAKHELALLPIFDEFAWDGRPTFICFDSDAATNPKVISAELRLSERLLDLGADIRIVRLQPSGESKVGLDDYIVANGPAKLSEMLDNAEMYVGSEMLHKLNERVIYVRNPGIVWDHQESMAMPPSAFKEHAFSDWTYIEYRETKTGTSMTEVSAAVKWLKWPARSAVSKLRYAPGQDRITEDGCLNVWTGWGLEEPVEGDISEWHRLLGHIFGGDGYSKLWFERWCAYPLQNPGVKMHTAAAIWGPVHGSGKSLIGYTLMRIYGRNSQEIKDANLEDERNQWAINKQFILADDITSKGDRRYMRRLMTLITQKSLWLDPKYIPGYSVDDCINYIFTSNDPDALFMDDQDRRFFVHEVKADLFPDHKQYVAWMNSNEGAAALWDYFLKLDLGDFDPHAPAPHTTGKDSMIELGKSDLGAWVLDLRQNADRILAKVGAKGDLFSAQELHTFYDPAGNKRASTNALARELKRAGFFVAGGSDETKIKRGDGSTVRVYAVRNLDQWRRAGWKAACDHFNSNRPEAKKGKF